MRSPLHSNAILIETEIDPGLLAWRCPTSGGVWIPLKNYLDWQSRQPDRLSGPADTVSPELLDDAGQPALICPESGRVMLRYRVGRGLPFHLDRSPATGGVWLDAGEWDALKSAGLHSRLHLIFTASYQRSVRSDSYEQAMTTAFRERIGGDDFDRVLDFKSWIAAHPRRYEICCYLMNSFSHEADSTAS